MLNKIHHGDCLEIMKDIPDKSIDMILCDLPYGTTVCKWDTIIPFNLLWGEYERIIKDKGAIVLTASQPFTSALVMSNPSWFRHEWIWIKSHGAFATAKYQPLKRHESVLVFSRQSVDYNPQMVEREGKIRDHRKEPYAKSGKSSSKHSATNPNLAYKLSENYNPKMAYPKSLLTYANSSSGRLHPTQKPVGLFEYLIKTYSNTGDVVLDNCIGSGTTAVAAINTGRDFIGIEQELEYCLVANERIEETRRTKCASEVVQEC